MKEQIIENREIEVEIERIVPRGYGLAHAEGLTLFVALAAAGDRVRVQITEVKGKIGFAEIVGIVDPSPHRITPPCPYFGVCGGCDFQQMTYAAQLAAKVDIIRDCLRRIAKIDHEGEIAMIGSPREFEYRSRAHWHLDANSREIGYYKRNSRDLVAIEVCPKLVPELNAELGRLKTDLPWEHIWSEKAFVEAAVGGDGSVSLNSPDLFVPEAITYTVRGETFRYSAGVFFQGNRYLVPELLNVALDGAEGGTALDLYCGVGLFSLPMARTFKRVIGVEENPESVRYANENAAANGITNIDFRAESVRRFLNGSKKGVDFILLDPPRAGTEKETMKNLIELDAAQVSYVACEPSVLARDLKRFIEKGYKIDSLTAIDLFPQTHHVETVARLSKR